MDKKLKKLPIVATAALLVAGALNIVSAQTPAPAEWSVNGNVLSHGEFLGTLNQQPIRFYTSGSQRGIFSQYSGFLGVGTNAPKNPLHIHSDEVRTHPFDFMYLDPDPPVRTGLNTSEDYSAPAGNNTSSVYNPYAALQITNTSTGAGPDDGVLLYAFGQQGFLRQMEDELFVIGMRDKNIMNFTPQGNVGIGTDNPFQMLHVMEGNILISKDPNANNRAPGSINGSMLFGAEVDNNTPYGRWGIEYVNDNSAGCGLNFWQPHGQNQNTVNYRLFLADNGNIGIKTNHPQAELAVNGTVLVRAVRVNIDASYWPDYVFANDYRMMSLSELEGYVNEHRHLPGIPSASEVEEEGSVDLGEMNTLLLQKVEELTRYIIDLQKQIDELKKRKE